MLPDDLRKMREGLFYSQSEFAELLGELRDAPIPVRTIQSWESGENRKRLPLYKTDIVAIERATRPHNPLCGCGLRAIVRKNALDLCAQCATPINWPTSKKLAVGA